MSLSLNYYTLHELVLMNGYQNLRHVWGIFWFKHWISFKDSPIHPLETTRNLRIGSESSALCKLMKGPVCKWGNDNLNNNCIQKQVKELT